MADYTKSERLILILTHLLDEPKQSFSLSQIMHSLHIPETDRRNLQRDINSLVNLPGGIVVCKGEGPHKTYKTGLKINDKFELPNFEERLLQFVFLQRIANIYPGTADLIDKLLDRILNNLSRAKREELNEVYKDIYSKVLFMGTQPTIDESAYAKLNIILKAIRNRCEIRTHYAPTWSEEKKSDRIPLMIVLYQNEIYVACVRHGNSEAVYAIKLSRIKSVEIVPKIYAENSTALNAIRKRVRDLSLFDREQGTETIVLTIPKECRQYIEERPYHRSMKIEEMDNELLITMNVNVNTQLVQWLLFHTQNDITVVEPAHLKECLLEFGKELVKKYK